MPSMPSLWHYEPRFRKRDRHCDPPCLDKLMPQPLSNRQNLTPRCFGGALVRSIACQSSSLDLSSNRRGGLHVDADIGKKLATRARHRTIRLAAVLQHGGAAAVHRRKQLAQHIRLAALGHHHPRLEVGLHPSPPALEAVAQHRLDEDADRLQVEHHRVRLGEIDFAPFDQRLLEAIELGSLARLLPLLVSGLGRLESELTHGVALLARSRFELFGALLEADDAEEPVLGVLLQQLARARHDVRAHLLVALVPILVGVPWDDDEDGRHPLRFLDVLLLDQIGQ
mmetsp:Transcript_37274/g.102876  ORF Transcript_37274/g.102876 Transcript_37274/m.102876 type:complete len:283 (-) Transcript_37274:506-1354(-)